MKHRILPLLIIILLLTSYPNPATSQKILFRPVTITALVDRDTWEQDPERNRREIKEIIQFVGKIFKNEWGLTFIIRSIRPWDFPSEQNEVDMDHALLAIAKTIDYQDSDITIGFTKKPLFLYETVEIKTEGKKEPTYQQTKGRRVGIAYNPGKVAVVSMDNSLALRKRITLHEIGHTFGAPDISDANSIMYLYIGEDAPVVFDNKNKKIIQGKLIEKFSIHHAP